MNTSTSETACHPSGDSPETGHILVLGIGNVLWADEGFGVRLENTVLVTEAGPRDLMADVPIEAGEIEALINRR